MYERIWQRVAQSLDGEHAAILHSIEHGIRAFEVDHASKVYYLMIRQIDHALQLGAVLMYEMLKGGVR